VLKKSASIVLASLRGSTYRSVRLTSSLAAALLDDLFENPASTVASTLYGKMENPEDIMVRKPSFSAAC
jgi:hypothetical protein